MCGGEGVGEKNEGEEQRNACGEEGACEKNEGGGVMTCVVERVHVKRTKGEE